MADLAKYIVSSFADTLLSRVSTAEVLQGYIKNDGTQTMKVHFDIIIHLEETWKSSKILEHL